MAITKIQEDVLRRFAGTFDLVCYFNGEPITLDQGIDVFKGVGLTKKGVDDRKKAFKAQLMPYLTQKTYSKEMLVGFGSYWCELSHGGSKMRFELEKTWELKMRLERWSRSNFGKGKGGAPQATITQTPIKSKDLF
jgi:hypothetical protein